MRENGVGTAPGRFKIQTEIQTQIQNRRSFITNTKSYFLYIMIFK